ncbi:hypothetical protein GCM10022393_37250 [Aquimarina addita]|uniref:MORN repeat protein n=1 Tax=Aquimarina addita TaxID=870485 RepID=A0ABP6URK2_9FLAO
MYKLLFLAIACCFCTVKISAQKEYTREYYDNGILKAKGWKIGTTKTDYWFHYHQNGAIAEQGGYKNNQKEGYWYFHSQNQKLSKEGHFKNNKAESWWIIYDIHTLNNKNRIIKKYQYQGNKKNGYGLLYKNNILFKAEKYINDQKIAEWTDVYSFKKDNPSASL